MLRSFTSRENENSPTGEGRQRRLAVLLPLLCVELLGVRNASLPQCGQPTSLELIYPTLDCASIHSEPIPDSITIEPMADEQNGMQAVVVADSADLVISDFKACRWLRRS